VNFPGVTLLRRLHRLLYVGGGWLIRIMSDAPFIFVSGLTDRLGYFNQDLGPRTVAQNFLAAHNAGIAVVWTLAQALKWMTLS